MSNKSLSDSRGGETAKVDNHSNSKHDACMLVLNISFSTPNVPTSIEGHFHRLFDLGEDIQDRVKTFDSECSKPSGVCFDENSYV